VLPLKASNIASAREKSIRHGHPITLHLWWARWPFQREPDFGVTNEQMRKINNAAGAAHKELLEHLDDWSARAVTKWWAKWYLKAGHKRLGRLLVDIVKQKESAG
jgi:Protein of unknown function (DUF1156)